MSSNRRAFLQFAGLAPAAAATAGLASSAAVHAAAGRIVNRSSFLPCIGDEFHFETGPYTSKPAKLARIEPLQQGREQVATEGNFRLEFEPLTPGTIAQDTYTVTHARLGKMVIFVSPNDAEGRVVEAVFNRL